jgi:hypothetical protein
MNNPKHIRIAGLLIALVALVAVFALPIGAQDDAADPARYPVDTISVNGNGSAAGTPDIATMEIGVETRNADVRAAFAENNATIDAVINALVNAGVAREDIRTTGVNMYFERFGMMGPMDGFGEEATPSYVINNIVRVVLRDTDSIGDVMSSAIEAGANNIYGLNFGIEDRSDLESEARAEAMANALTHATELAELAGAELGDILIVSEGWSGGSPFDVVNMAERGLGGGGGAPIEPGQLSVQVQLQVTYRLNR